MKNITGMWTWMRVQFFRFWTALVVLGAYGYFWLNTPEYLTWWKRTVNTLIEKGCDMLPYPWGDRIESLLWAFGMIPVSQGVKIVISAMYRNGQTNYGNYPRGRLALRRLGSGPING